MHYDTLAPRFGQMGWIAFFLAAAFQLVSLVVRFDLCILYEDNHLLVVNKPAGLATMGTGDEHTVHSLACDYLRQKYQKPGNVYLGVVHRLDSMSSGTLVLARTSKAAARLSEQFRRSSESLSADRPNAKKNEAPSPQKSYLAVVRRIGGSDWERNAWSNDDFRDGVPFEGILRDWVVKNEREHRMEVTGKSTKDAVEAVLDFRRVDDVGSRLKAVHQRDAEAMLDPRRVDDVGSRLKAVHQRDAEAMLDPRRVDDVGSRLKAVHQRNAEAMLDSRRVDDAGSRLKAVHQRDAEAMLDPRRVDDAGSRLKAVHQRDAEAVVEVQLRTGRKHQIRVQFASRGYPVWGDVKYGARQQRGTGIALHAWRLSIEHPTAKTEMVFQSPIPTIWRQWFPAVRHWPTD